MSPDLEAFRDVDFGWVRSLDSVWRDADATVGGPNAAIVDEIVAALMRIESGGDPPQGRILLGQAGVGKTHLVGNLRRQTWKAGGWFVLLDVVGITDFWRSAALSFITSLLQEMADGRRQLEAVLAGIARRFRVEKEVDVAFASPSIEPRRVVDLLVGGLMRADPANALRYQDVFRALAFLRAHDVNSAGVAHAWLQGYDADEASRQTLGFRAPPATPIELVRGMAWVMSLAAPILVAVDQIDGLVNPASRAAGSDFGETPDFGLMLSDGLRDLWDVNRRGLTVVTCLHDSWRAIEKTALRSTLGRFRPPTALVGLNNTTAVSDLIARRLAPAYAAHGHRPLYPTWPFTMDAVRQASAAAMTPRTILMRCDAFRRACVEDGRIRSCLSIADVSPPSREAAPEESDFAALLESARADADPASYADPQSDDLLSGLLRDAFDLYAKQLPRHADIDVESKADPAQRVPPLHGRLTITYHAQGDRELHVCYRVLDQTNPNSFIARLRAALTAAGISARLPDRRLLIIRRTPVPSGPKSRELHEAFLAAGGIVTALDDGDLRTFLALRTLRDRASAEGRVEAFEGWLQARRPLCATGLFQLAGLCPPPDNPSAPASRPPEPMAARSQEPEDEIDFAVPPSRPSFVEDAAGSSPPDNVALIETIPVGRRIGADSETILLPVKNLPRHTAIIAGAGSGKTVLLRRIVEEAALAGIPAIVIDPNNDLSRLGDAWPEPPAVFTPEDCEKAKAYAARIEVVVWTPGIHAGNPLFLSVLPDFAALGDDIDEREQAVAMAADTLGPLAGAKTNIPRGVLADALRCFAARGGGALRDMIALLADLPEGVSEINGAEKHAARMADELRAAVATNPLLKGTGAVLDPARLFEAKSPGLTRVSVVNLSGLGSDEAKEDFVNRLQMTLFGWVKRHPSPRGRLYVIDEAQIFIPSGAGALSKTSGVQLVAQARKYGLGMVVATQAPKGIDNKVVSNCTTQFLGKQNAPATIEAAKDLIAASGGRADDFGRLKMAEFYYKTEASGKPVKIATPICLTWHPANPPTPEEVVVRAKRSVP